MQLLEAENKLDFASLRYMAETISGSFTITTLDEKDNLCIDQHGRIERSSFDASNLWPWGYGGRGLYGHGHYGGAAESLNEKDRYLDELKSVATCYGFSAKAIDRLLADGFSTDEIKEFIYCSCGEM